MGCGSSGIQGSGSRGVEGKTPLVLLGGGRGQERLLAFAMAFLNAGEPI